jgi:hypothetical protein
VPVLTALDRSGAICQTQLPNTKWASISEAMVPWIEADSVICSDGYGAYVFDVFAGADTIEEVTVKALKEAEMLLLRVQAALVEERNRLAPPEPD